jgi:hypothetical protein
LGARARVPWLAEMNGPAREPVRVTAGGRDVVQYAFCKPHDCHDNNVLLLWDPASRTLVGALYINGRVSLLGSPSPAMSSELGRRWRALWRQGR